MIFNLTYSDPLLLKQICVEKSHQLYFALTFNVNRNLPVRALQMDRSRIKCIEEEASLFMSENLWLSDIGQCFGSFIFPSLQSTQ